MNTRIERAIRARHTDWSKKIKGVLVFELATGTGYAHGEPNRIDAFHMAVEPSEGLKRTAYEVKISRSDFLREIKDPRKRRAALRVSNQFYFVAPEGMLEPSEIPLECGLLEIHPAEDRLIEKVAAPFRDGAPASWHFFASFARRLQRSALQEESVA